MKNEAAISKHDMHIVKGILIAGYGVLFLAYKLGTGIPSWAVSWEAILILVGVYSGIKENFRNNFWIISILTGLFFLADDIFPGVRMRDYVWPIVIISAGIFYMIKPANRPFKNHSWGQCGSHVKNNFKTNTHSL